MSWALPLSHLAIAAGPGCGARSCHHSSPNIVAYVIFALIAALLIFDLAWRLKTGARGPIARFFIKIVAALPGGGRGR